LTAQLLELGDYFFFLNICQRFGQSGGGRLEFSEVDCFGLLPAGRDIDPKRFSATGDGNRCTGFQEGCNPLAEFAHADFDCCHKNLLAYA